MRDHYILETNHQVFQCFNCFDFQSPHFEALNLCLIISGGEKMTRQAVNHDLSKLICNYDLTFTSLIRPMTWFSDSQEYPWLDLTNLFHDLALFKCWVIFVSDPYLRHIWIVYICNCTYMQVQKSLGLTKYNYPIQTNIHQNASILVMNSPFSHSIHPNGGQW